MDTERTHEIEPDGLDRAIHAALSVDPSPEFLVRVRARIADEHRASPWRLRLIPVIAAAATVVILALLVANASKRPVPKLAGREEPRVAATVSAATESGPAAGPHPENRQPRTVSRHRRSVVPGLSTEARGLRALVKAIDDGRINMPIVVEIGKPEQSLQIRNVEIAPLAIPSISVEPMSSVTQ